METTKCRAVVYYFWKNGLRDETEKLQTIKIRTSNYYKINNEYVNLYDASSWSFHILKAIICYFYTQRGNYFSRI